MPADRLTYVLTVDPAHEAKLIELISAVPGITFYRIRSGPASVGELDPGKLSARLEQVLRLVIQGKSNKAIGRMLGISHYTVRNHVGRLLRMYDAANRDALVQLIEGHRVS